MQICLNILFTQLLYKCLMAVPWHSPPNLHIKIQVRNIVFFLHAICILCPKTVYSIYITNYSVPLDWVKDDSSYFFLIIFSTNAPNMQKLIYLRNPTVLNIAMPKRKKWFLRLTDAQCTLMPRHRVTVAPPDIERWRKYGKGEKVLAYPPYFFSHTSIEIFTILTVSHKILTIWKGILSLSLPPRPPM